jgi:hypothetical protein
MHEKDRKVFLRFLVRQDNLGYKKSMRGFGSLLTRCCKRQTVDT